MYKSVNKYNKDVIFVKDYKHLHDNRKVIKIHKTPNYSKENIKLSRFLKKK